MKFQITVVSSYEMVAELEADSLGEAQKMALDGDYEIVDQESLCSIVKAVRRIAKDG